MQHTTHPYGDVGPTDPQGEQGEQGPVGPKGNSLRHGSILMLKYMYSPVNWKGDLVQCIVGKIERAASYSSNSRLQCTDACTVSKHPTCISSNLPSSLASKEILDQGVREEH